MNPFRWPAKIWSEIEYLLGEVETVLPVRFIGAWFRSRNYLDLLLGLPTILAAVFLCTGVMIAWYPAPPITVDTAVRTALRAKQQGDDELADLYLLKAEKAVGGTANAKFHQALLLLSAEKHREGISIINQLSPVDKPGHVPGHEWRISQLSAQLDANLGNEEPSDEEIAQRKELTGRIAQQWDLIYQADPDHLIANEKLAALRFSEGKTEQAAKHLANVVERNQNLRLLYAQLLASLDEEQKAEAETRRAVSFHQSQLADAELSEEETLNHQFRLATAYSMLEQYEEAARTLLSDEQRLPEDKRARLLLGEVLLRWSDSIDAVDGPTLIRKFELLDEALRLRPGDPRMLARIANVAGQKGEAAEQARLALKEILATGRAPAVVHFILGIQAYERDDNEAAIRHLELANRVNPNTPMTLNNLGLILARQESPDLERAVELVNRAIELEADNGDYYDSRAQIHIKMEQYTEAIADFEQALRLLPNRADIRNRLADAYDVVGDQEQAKIHRNQAKQLSENQADPGTEPEAENGEREGAED